MKGIFALPVLLVSLAFVACGNDWSVGPSDGGGSFNGRFHYYYGEDCRYDAFDQPYDCMEPYRLSPSMSVDLRITRDGYATLCVDDKCSYYDPGEYDMGYDHGDRYYNFEGYDTRMVVYADGSELIYIDTYAGNVSYYYYNNPDDYDYYY